MPSLVSTTEPDKQAMKPQDPSEKLDHLIGLTGDDARPEAVERRHASGFRTARENLEDLCDAGSFVEYGQLAIAAQRQRREIDDLRAKTPADGVITGLATINSAHFGDAVSQAAVAINDYSVLAGTQGFYHHLKIDRILDVAAEKSLPVVMFAEGGGGRPGDTDVNTWVAGLNLPTFSKWAGMSGKSLRLAVANGYCFAGNAALFGAADIRIATRQSWIGMAGPAMIEGGGLGRFDATEIGPAELQAGIGVVDLLVEDEAEAVKRVKNILGYFQGALEDFDCADQAQLAGMLPEDRRYSYHIRKVIETIADTGSFLELYGSHGGAIVTGFTRIGGKPIGLLANDCRVLGGAIDVEAAKKAARFMRLCNDHGLPILSLCDTPGFMVGPESEAAGAVNSMPGLFVAGAALAVPLITIILRKAYGLGAMAMAGGSFANPVYTAAWPTGEFGAMGLEGAVKLGFRKELEAETDPEKREALLNRLVEREYERGQATEAASHLEIDAVIQPADTRKHVLQALAAY
jgi:acetyl-CoA carboxylase carboxyltransferase component